MNRTRLLPYGHRTLTSDLYYGLPQDQRVHAPHGCLDDLVGTRQPPTWLHLDPEGPAGPQVHAVTRLDLTHLCLALDTVEAVHEFAAAFTRHGHPFPPTLVIVSCDEDERGRRRVAHAVWTLSLDGALITPVQADATADRLSRGPGRITHEGERIEVDIELDAYVPAPGITRHHFTTALYPTAGTYPLSHVR